MTGVFEPSSAFSTSESESTIFSAGSTLSGSLPSAHAMRAMKPLQLPRLSVAQAKAASTLAVNGAQFSFPLLPIQGSTSSSAKARALHRWQWQLAPTKQGNVDPQDKRLWLDWAGAKFCLALSPSFWETWLAARLPEMDRVALPAPFVDAAIEAMLDEFVGRLKKRVPQIPAQIVMTSPPQAEAVAGDAATNDAAANDVAANDAYSHHWLLTGCDNVLQRQFSVALAMDEAGLNRLADLLAAGVSPSENDLSLDDVALRVRAVVGSTTLPAGDWHTCVPGDIVFFDESWAQAEGELWLTTPDGQGIRVRPVAASGEHSEFYESSLTSSFLVTQGWTLLMIDKLRTDPDRENEESDEMPDFLPDLSSLMTDKEGEENLFAGINKGHDGEDDDDDHDDMDEEDEDARDDDDDTDEEDEDARDGDDDPDGEDEDARDDDDDPDEDDEDARDDDDDSDEEDEDDDDDSDPDDEDTANSDDEEDDDEDAEDDDDDEYDDDDEDESDDDEDDSAYNDEDDELSRVDADTFSAASARFAALKKTLNSAETQPDVQLDAQHPALNVDAIPVRLTFELGERALTLGDLRRLRPGVVFDLDRPLNSGPVWIYANGRRIGSAELVEIEGRTGVRIVQLRPVRSG